MRTHGLRCIINARKHRYRINCQVSSPGRSLGETRLQLYKRVKGIMAFLLIARDEAVHFHKFEPEKFANGPQDAGCKLENDLHDLPNEARSPGCYGNISLGICLANASGWCYE